DRDRLADEVARLRGALERSADTLNACEGVMRNAGDIAAAMEASVEEALARRALTATGGPTDDAA
ncbi:hypothetical protein, partial [Methylobacterium sp. J-092]|uniref:hypothetical protein n=1 Tax=Methylobacterium sp. J-092 TaxID=2836667 RepID=UPI001FBA19C2